MRIESIREINQVSDSATVLVPVVAASHEAIEKLCKKYSIAGGSVIATDLSEQINGALMCYSDDTSYKRIILYSLPENPDPIMVTSTCRISTSASKPTESCVVPQHR